MKITRLAESLYVFAFPVGNVYLWTSPDGLTLVDTGLPGSGAALADGIRRLGRRPGELRRVVLTHFHQDHVGAAAEVAAWGEVEVLAHEADIPFIQGDVPGPPPNLLEWEKPLFDQIHAGIPEVPVPPVRVDRALADGDVIDLGRSALALAVPGHTPGSVALHLPEERILFTGDTVARLETGEVVLGVFNTDPLLAAASFKRQAALDVEIACVGHGVPVTGDAGRRLREAADAL